MRFLREDAHGFSSAETALLVSFALAFILLVAKLIGDGHEQAAGDAQRTLVRGMSGGGDAGFLVGNMLRPQELVRADRPVAHIETSNKAQGDHRSSGGFQDAVSGFLRPLGSVVGSVLDYINGAAGQFASNILFGGLDPLLDQNGSRVYQAGRRLGDAASVAAGAIETIEGGGMIGGAIAITAVVEVGTLGVATPVVVIVDGAALAGGLAMIGHGSWMVGKGVDGLGKNRTPEGSDGSPRPAAAPAPSPSTLKKEFPGVKRRYWKHEAKEHQNRYSPENVARMQLGKPPLGPDGYPMELHHKTPLANGGTNDFDNLLPMTQTEHRRGENYLKNHPELPAFKGK